jgi:S1-C subfamily serine protease
VVSGWVISREQKWVTFGERRRLTCYHVVQGAISIEMLNGGTLISDDSIVVEKVDPVHDLASLKVTNAGQGIRFYPLGSDLPTPVDDLWVIGYEAGLQNQTVTVRTTQSGYAKSGRFLDGRTSLFAQRDVDLIPLDALVYRGMSGAPLVFRGRTIGIVSGSLAEGRALAWAIPATYINSASAVSIQRRAGLVKPRSRSMRWSH